MPSDEHQRQAPKEAEDTRHLLGDLVDSSEDILKAADALS
jgi:hypothetical protein